MEACQIDKTGKLRLNDQVCFALHSTSRAITKAYGKLLSQMGITYPQYLVMLLLWEGDGILVSKIAQALEIDGGTATPLVQRLEKLELASRVRCPDDERRVRVFLTDKGKSYYEMALDVPHGLGCVTGLDAVTASQIVGLMNKIKSVLGNQLED